VTVVDRALAVAALDRDSATSCKAAWTDEHMKEWRAFVNDPEANGGLSMLQDCGIEGITMMLDEIDRLNARLKEVFEAIDRGDYIGGL
jgi:hypothetical protein